MKFAAVTIAFLASGANAFAPSPAGSILNRPFVSSSESRTRLATHLHAAAGDGAEGGFQSSTALSASTLADADIIMEPSIVEEDQAMITTQQKSYLDDGFVFGLEGSGIERPKGKSANIVVEGDSLETQPWQVAAVGTTFAGHAYFSSMAVSQMLALNGGDVALTAAQSLALVVSSWVLADLGSGILHWSVDNYGNGRTPIMGGIIAAFQGHHSAPWTITYRGFCNNVYKLCVPFGIPTMAAISALAGPTNPAVTLFFTVFCAMEILSQEFHKWSHMTKGEVPDWVNWLQDVGLTIPRTPHALHHKAPYDGNYCIISGVCNEPLDKSGFFRWLEHRVYEWNGVESNAWKLDPELRARTLRGEYGLEH